MPLGWQLGLLWQAWVSWGRSLSASLGPAVVVSCPSIIWKAVMSGSRGACRCSNAEELSCPGQSIVHKSVL